jgi:hypothetical protein
VFTLEKARGEYSLEGPAPVQSTVHHRLILGGLMYMIQVLEHV